MVSTKIYNRICKMHDQYHHQEIEEVNALIERGKELIQLHGEDDLQYKLNEEEWKAAHAYFLYKLAIDESLYTD